MHIALFGLNAKGRNKQTNKKIQTQFFLLKLITHRLKNGKAVVS